MRALTRPLALALLLAASLPARRAAAEPEGPLPIIESGRDAEIRALTAPLTLDHEVSPGWTLAGISITPTAILFLERGPGAATATLRLEHPDRAPSPEHTASFALHREAKPGPDGKIPALTTLDPLATAVRENDHGTFWRSAPRIAPAPASTAAVPGTSSLTVVEQPLRWEVTGKRKALLGGLGASLLLLGGDALLRRRKRGVRRA
ncbi:MAG: hypothetical protein U0359_22595 [Byssovorax sp.]